MATHNIRVAFNALADSSRSLIDTPAGDIDKYPVYWVPYMRPLSLSYTESRGVWNMGHGPPLTFTLLGVVDATRSHLSSYGNCNWDMKENHTPSYKDLLKASFSVDLTYPSIPSGHMDEDISVGLVNQLYRLEDIKAAATAQLLAQGHPPPLRVTEWVHFDHSPNAVGGWMRVFIGHVFEHANGPTTPEDTEDDPNDFLGTTGVHALKHNTALPCYTANGTHIGRTGAHLRNELYHGRWVKVDAELATWYLERERTLIYRLKATRLETLNAPPAIISSFEDPDGPNPGPGGNSVKVEMEVNASPKFECAGDL